MMEAYHRRRQNLQYQSLHQPGIVCGLGVHVVSAPESVESRFQDNRWLEIQPGIAIDLEGNPIIVASSQANPSKDDLSLKFRINLTPASGQTLTVYVVVSYSEPKATPNHTEELLREWFRFDQLTHPPSGDQVELCRIELQDPIALENPTHVLFPKLNELDFRHRQQAKIRPQTAIHVAQLIPNDDFNESDDFASIHLYQTSAENLADLIQAMGNLDDPLQAYSAIQQVSLSAESLGHWDILYIPDGQMLRQLADPQMELLKDYVQQGGGLLVETVLDDHELLMMQQFLQKVLPEDQETTFVSWNTLSRYHPIRRSPFLFGALPEVQAKPIQIYVSDGVVLINGRLSAAWGLAEVPLSRADIRTAQELGINLLHFLWQRRRFTQLLQWDIAPGSV